MNADSVAALDVTARPSASPRWVQARLSLGWQLTVDAARLNTQESISNGIELFQISILRRVLWAWISCAAYKQRNLMRKFDFLQVDVFTSTPLQGNPCAIIFEADDLGHQAEVIVAGIGGQWRELLAQPERRHEPGQRRIAVRELIALIL